MVKNLIDAAVLHKALFCLVCVGLLIALSACPAGACEGSAVRDSAFRGPRDVHRLCVMANQGDQQADGIFRELEGWLKAGGKDLNIKLLRVHADEPGIDWQKEYGLPGAPPALPVVVLAGYPTMERKAFYIRHWEPAPGQTDLPALETSPLRETLRSELGRKMALLLYIRGTGPDAGRAEPVVRAAADRWSKKEPLGVSVLKLDRAAPQESLTLSFIGEPADGPDWVCVVFGRGKFMPPFKGEQITAESLDQQLEVLLGNCSCLRSPLALGVDLPMKWEKKLDDQAASLLSPAALAATRPVDTQPAAGPVRDPSRRSFLSATAVVISGLIIVVVIASLILLRRRRL